MQIINIYNDSSDLLHQEAELVLFSESEIRDVKEIIESLLEVTEKKKFLPGIAAEQIGALKQVFLCSFDIEHLKDKNYEIIINPIITKYYDDKIIYWENCLSTADFGNGERKVAQVERSKMIDVEYYNFSGEKFIKHMEGAVALIFQHEYDHLHGILNIDNKSNDQIKTFDDAYSMIEFFKSEKRTYEEIIFKLPEDINNVDMIDNICQLDCNMEV